MSDEWPPPPGFAWLQRSQRKFHYFNLRRLRANCGRHLTQFFTLRSRELPPASCQCRSCRLKLFPVPKPGRCRRCGNVQGTDQRDFVSATLCGVCAPRVERKPSTPWWDRELLGQWWNRRAR